MNKIVQWGVGTVKTGEVRRKRGSKVGRWHSGEVHSSKVGRHSILGPELAVKATV